MHYGFRIVEDMIDGLKNWMDSKGFATLDDFRGLSLPHVTEWKHLDLNYKIVARIHPELCIGCDLCYTACWDGAHQCIHLNGHAKPAEIESASRERIVCSPVTRDAQAALDPSRTPPHRIPHVDEQECVGCNLCKLVCPVDNCITMERVDLGKAPETWEQRSAHA